MQESKRQLQVAKLIQEELNTIFQKNGWSMMQGGMVSISKVSITPDLLESKIYLSLFQIQDKDAVMKHFKENLGEIRGALGNKLRHQLRRIPSLEIINDDTLDYVFKMEALLNKVKSESPTGLAPQMDIDNDEAE